jgi:hypothetical protein
VIVVTEAPGMRLEIIISRDKRLERGEKENQLADSLWESLFLFHRIFKRSAEFVAEKRGFRFPRETAVNSRHRNR